MNTHFSLQYETIVGYNFTQKNGPTGGSDTSNRAYLLNELAESRMR